MERHSDAIKWIGMGANQTNATEWNGVESKALGAANVVSRGTEPVDSVPRPSLPHANPNRGNRPNCLFACLSVRPSGIMPCCLSVRLPVCLPAAWHHKG
jgi:hypothetical protein